MALDTDTKTVKQFSLKVTQSSKLNVNKSPEVGRGTDKDGMNVPLHMKKKIILNAKQQTTDQHLHNFL